MAKLEVVSEKIVPDQADLERQQAHAAAMTAHAQQQTEIATKMLLMAVQSLGQRFVVALANLFTLITAATVFYLWMMALPEINTQKIIGLTIYAVFVLGLNVYGRTK